jgi:hypothetical protein
LCRTIFQLEAIMKADRDIERDVRDELQWES